MLGKLHKCFLFQISLSDGAIIHVTLNRELFILKKKIVFDFVTFDLDFIKENIYIRKLL